MTTSDDQIESRDQADPVPSPRRAGRAKIGIAAAVLAVAAVGGGTYAVLHTTDAGATASTSVGGQGGAGGPGGTARGTGGATGGPPAGTVVSTTADSITVELSSGTTTTYTLADGATVQDDGATVALTDLTVGEQVKIFTGQPGSDSTEATRVVAGTSAAAGPGAGGGAGDDAGGGGAGGGGGGAPSGAPSAAAN